MSTRSAESAPDELLYLDRASVIESARVLDPIGTVEVALQRQADGQAVLPPEAYLGWQTPDGAAARSLAMPGRIATAHGDAIGIKVINGSLGNIDRGLPRAQGLIMLFDPELAWPAVVMEAAYISATRTACLTALSARYLAVPGVSRIAVSGCGALARAHLSVLSRELPGVTMVSLFDLDHRRVTRLAGELREDPGLDLDIRETSDIVRCVDGAHLVVTATTTTAGYLGFDALSPGTLVAHVSLDDVLPDVVQRADLVLVDDWGLVSQDDRRLLGQLYRAGRLRGPDGGYHPDSVPDPAARRVDGTLTDVISGRHPGRRSADDVILSNPFGMSILDVALAHEVYRSAIELDLGTPLRR